MKNLLILHLLIVFTTSCAVITPKRSPAEISRVCREALLDSTSVSAREPTLQEILAKREAISKEYRYLAESIRDFEIQADLPIRTQAKLLLNSQEALLAKILLIRRAKQTIDLSYYIFKEDAVSRALLHELRLAMQRGVKVRILVDFYGSRSKAPLYRDIKALLELNGQPILDEMGRDTGLKISAEAVLFNPIFNIRAHIANWYRKVHNLFVRSGRKLPPITFSFSQRSHDKILMIDAYSKENSYVVVGGRNISNRYYSIAPGREAFILDAEILIKGLTGEDGSAENRVEEHFNKIFYYLANKNFSNFLIGITGQQKEKELQKMSHAHAELFGTQERAGALSSSLQKMESEAYLEKDFESGLVSILNEIQNLSRTRASLNGNSIVSKIHEQISKSQKSVDLISPYFWMPASEIDLLISWAEQNPERKVRIFSNSIGTTNSIIAQAMVDRTYELIALRTQKNPRIAAQFELYSYGRTQEQGLLHAKLAVFDGKTFVLSTSNLDPISRYRNSEVGVAVGDLPENSQNLQDIHNYMETLVGNSVIWGSSEWQQLRTHPKNRLTLLLEKMATKIIHSLELISDF